MSPLFPPVPDEVPVLIETSNSQHYGPEASGIDIATQWWCEATRRPNGGDAIVTVTAPGEGLWAPLLNLVLPAHDLDETEAAAHLAIRIARQVVRLIADRGDADAMAELKELLSPLGPMDAGSQRAWHALLEWLPGMTESQRVPGLRFPVLNLAGYGVASELWSTTEVAAYLGYSGPSAEGSARKQLSRWGLTSAGREVGRRGQSQYVAAQVRERHENRPGSGRRSATRKGGRFTTSD